MQDKLDINRKYFLGGFAFLPWLWFVVAHRCALCLAADRALTPLVLFFVLSRFLNFVWFFNEMRKPNCDPRIRQRMMQRQAL